MPTPTHHYKVYILLNDSVMVVEYGTGVFVTCGNVEYLHKTGCRDGHLSVKIITGAG